VLGSVRARHNDMIKIEKSILQLLELLEILTHQIVEQEALVADVATKAEETTQQLDGANVQIKKSTVSALRARKLKWWCLGICVLIVIIIALAVGLYFGLPRAGADAGNNGTQ
jgi:syntaxin 1B/2/3